MSDETENTEISTANVTEAPPAVPSDTVEATNLGDSGDVSEELGKLQKFIKEAKSLAFLLTLVFVFRSVFFEPFRIPSGSMIPTLMIGDFILVNKFAYGLKVPFSDLAIGNTNWNPVYPFGMSQPKRGDVIVFKFPEDPAVNYIKRVVGLPGDVLEIRNKIVYINNEPIATEQIEGKEIMDDMDDKFKAYNLSFYKAKTGDHDHVIQFDSDNLLFDNYDTITIPRGKYFVMGDNRDFSSDSRVWRFVPEENIKGKAILVWFSMIFFPVDDFKFRPHRIGTLIK